VEAVHSFLGDILLVEGNLRLGGNCSPMSAYVSSCASIRRSRGSHRLAMRENIRLRGALWVALATAIVLVGRHVDSVKIGFRWLGEDVTLE
jgi:hypothetical protein